MLIAECPLCGGRERCYGFLVGEERFDTCTHCGLLSHHAPEGEEPSEQGASPKDPDEEGFAGALLARLDGYVGGGDRRLGVLGDAGARFLEEARRRGFEPRVLAGDAPAAPEHGVLVVMYQLEDALDPVGYARALRAHLRPGGVAALVTRQLVKPDWHAEVTRVLERHQRYSFSDANLETVLWKAGFREVLLSHRASGRPNPGWSRDQVFALARMAEPRARPRLSVVLPVYNEARTVGQVLDALVAKEMPGLDLEIIVVESASTDGSREIVERYRNRGPVRLVLEDRPRGKGFAVRTGLRYATGDVILIQDADLEYDLLDYELLVNPILLGRAAFVLGTRHNGTWKIRRFAQNRLATLMNVAHFGLLALMNHLYRQSMTDPFTMFKVFRSDCLFGLEFECNRFDFDIELVCKLLRKGYVPLEIPVNYQSRSFDEGKKVRIFRDPPTWIRAMFKYRLGPVVKLPPAGRPVVLPGEGEDRALPFPAPPKS